MEAKKFKVIIVEDVKLELKGTEEIFRHEIPDAEVIGTAMTEQEFWSLMETGVPDLVLLDLGLGGSTTIGVDICRNIFKRYPDVHVLIFTGEILNEKLWVDVLEAGADGIILKTGRNVSVKGTGRRTEIRKLYQISGHPDDGWRAGTGEHCTGGARRAGSFHPGMRHGKG